MTWLTVLAILLALAWALPALASLVHCTTHEEKTLDRLQTVCDDGTRAVSTWSPALQRWQTTITESPRQACTRQMTSRTHPVEVRCRSLMH
jgi:hypothetical protein